MANTPTNKQRTNYINTIGLCTAAVIALGVIWFFFFRPAPTYPLGDRLEYMTKVEYGCFLVCGSDRTSSYYYSTDLSPQEVVRYFKRGTLEDSNALKQQQDPSIPLTFSLRSPNGQLFYITYFTEGRKYSEGHGIRSPAHSHVLTIHDEQYQAAKDSL